MTCGAVRCSAWLGGVAQESYTVTGGQYGGPVHCGDRLSARPVAGWPAGHTRTDELREHDADAHAGADRDHRPEPVEVGEAHDEHAEGAAGGDPDQAGELDLPVRCVLCFIDLCAWREAA